MTAHWAAAYIGKPWTAGGDGPGAYDCLGLVRGVYRERCAMDIPRVHVDAHSLLSCARAFLDYGSTRAHFERVATPADLDILQLSHGSAPHHVGIWLDIDGGGLLSALEGVGVVFQSRAALRAGGWNITDIYRKKGTP
jgi:cell wall-associated NlpC family hydrolase